MADKAEAAVAGGKRAAAVKTDRAEYDRSISWPRGPGPRISPRSHHSHHQSRSPSPSPQRKSLSKRDRVAWTISFAVGTLLLFWALSPGNWSFDFVTPLISSATGEEVERTQKLTVLICYVGFLAFFKGMRSVFLADSKRLDTLSLDKSTTLVIHVCTVGIALIGSLLWFGRDTFHQEIKSGLQPVLWMFITLRLLVPLSTSLDSLVRDFMQVLGITDATQTGFLWLNVGIKMLCWALGMTFLAGKFGYDVSLVTTGFGFGGLFLAFGLQETVRDVQAAMEVLFRRPYEVGHIIDPGKGQIGEVEAIYFKSTKLRLTNCGQVVFIPNKDILSSRIENYTLLQKRRVAFSFLISSETSEQKLLQLEEIVQQCCDSVEKVAFDSCVLSELELYGLRYQVIFHVTDPDGKTARICKHRVLAALVKELRDRKILLAKPTVPAFAATTPS